MKLIDVFGHYLGNKIQVVANYTNIHLEFHNIKLTALKEKEFLNKNPLGKIPVLETPEGFIYESHAIMRYLYRLNPECGLYGSSAFETSLIDQWLDFVSFELDPTLTALITPILGWGPAISDKDRGLSDLKKSLDIVENHLTFRTFLVGNKISLADISLAGTLIAGYKFMFEKSYRDLFPNVNRWFELITNQEPFLKIFGKIKYCEKEFPIFVPEEKTEEKEPKEPKEDQKKEKDAKKEAKKELFKKDNKKPEDKKTDSKEEKKHDSKDEKKESKKETKKEDKKDGKKEGKQKQSPKKQEKQEKEIPKKEAEEDDEEEKPKPKEKNPLDLLPESKIFNYNEFKTLYSNNPDKTEALQYLWKNFDPEGYSIWFVKYEKCPSEGKNLIHTNNLLGGYIRNLDMDNCRKYGFGVHGVFGDEPTLDIKGCWIWRGVNQPAEAFEYHEVVRCDPKNEADRKRAELFWRAKEGDVVEGLLAHKVEYYK